MKVDFHVHSTASDGTFTPQEIWSAAGGFEAIALTDHDNCDGATEWQGIIGIELSIEAGDGFDKFHLLGLGIDPKNAQMTRLLEKILEGRNQRNERILNNFARIGIDMPKEEIAGYAHGKVLAKPHFAQWLIDHNYVTNKTEAFANYLEADSPVETRCYEERYHPTQEEAFDAVHAAGGLCVMAHPKYWCNNWNHTGCDYAAAERELASLKERGLDGVESLYEANTEEENVEFTRIAMKLGYLTSAGSDFHGSNKPQIHLGMEVTEAFIKPLLEHLWYNKSK